MKTNSNTSFNAQDADDRNRNFIGSQEAFTRDNASQAIYASGEISDDDEEEESGDWGNVDPASSPDGLNSDNEPTAPGSAV
ncbi:MAG TPA: hypothetical protein VF676_01980 [Flavobacterium sp.]|jgi:hypothetical protein